MSNQQIRSIISEARTDEVSFPPADRTLNTRPHLISLVKSLYSVLHTGPTSERTCAQTEPGLFRTPTNPHPPHHEGVYHPKPDKLSHCMSISSFLFYPLNMTLLSSLIRMSPSTRKTVKVKSALGSFNNAAQLLRRLTDTAEEIRYVQAPIA